MSTINSWITPIVERLRPSFGGFATFCTDPDDLLEIPAVREALRLAGMTIADWDGTQEGLTPWKTIGEDDRPLILAPSSGLNHITDSVGLDCRWESVSIGSLFPRLHAQTVKAIPTEHWDSIKDLHDRLTAPLSAPETALRVARALYGADPERLRYGGLVSLLLRLALGGIGLPAPVAQALAPSGDIELAERLQDPIAIRDWLEDHSLPENAETADLLLTEALHREARQRKIKATASHLIEHWESIEASLAGPLTFGLEYASACAAEAVSQEQRAEVNVRFSAWIQQRYNQIPVSANPHVLHLPKLLEHLDQNVQGDRLLLVVVDALGLEAWEHVRQVWKTEKAIGKDETRAAFAVLPTITKLSRRSIFEGKLPQHFSGADHTPRLERVLWGQRFPGGSYFSVEEVQGIRDAFSVGTARICIMDISWDKRGHAIDPRYDSLGDAARTWARKTPLRQIISDGLGKGYRVVVTADHGQVECRGQGRPNVGSLPEDRSKRVLIFPSAALAQQHSGLGLEAFQPMGLKSDMYPLFPTCFSSFDRVGVETISHGGLALEEVLVPVAEVWA